VGKSRADVRKNPLDVADIEEIDLDLVPHYRRDDIIQSSEENRFKLWEGLVELDKKRPAVDLALGRRRKSLRTNLSETRRSLAGARLAADVRAELPPIGFCGDTTRASSMHRLIVFCAVMLSERHAT
jgi:hypothetical protein